MTFLIPISTNSNCRCEEQVTVSGRAPVLALCRELIAAGIDPDTARSVYRRGLLALKVRSIGAATKLMLAKMAALSSAQRPPGSRGAASPMHLAFPSRPACRM